MQMNLAPRMSSPYFKANFFATFHLSIIIHLLGEARFAVGLRRTAHAWSQVHLLNRFEDIICVPVTKETIFPLMNSDLVAL